MKKILAIALVMALLSIATIGGTLSYFTATDSDVNTMEVGNVKIQQNEEFTQKSALRPYIGTATVNDSGLLDTSKNAVTKIVTVKNIGTESAYIRTLFAFEAVNDADPLVVTDGAPIIHAIYNTDTNVGTWEKAWADAIEVNGVKYYVYSYTYKNAVAGTRSTDASLMQIALDCKQDNKFFDYVGSEYNVLVLSQAVQSTGFTATENTAVAHVALGEAFKITADNLVTWFTAVATPNP